MSTAQDRLTTDFALMRDVAAATDARSAEIRAMLQAFIGRVGAVPATVWSGPAAARFRDVVDRWNAESARLCQALDAIAGTIRANERVLLDAALAHESRIGGVGGDLGGRVMIDPVLSYDFAEIEYSVRQEIHTTSARLNAALDDLRARISPLQEIWTRESAAAYRLEQDRWHQAAGALNDILLRLGNAVRDGAGEIAETDRRAANAWR